MRLLPSNADFLQSDMICSSCLTGFLNKKKHVEHKPIMPISHISNEENSLRSRTIKHCHFPGKESRRVSEQFKVSNVA